MLEQDDKAVGHHAAYTGLLTNDDVLRYDITNLLLVKTWRSDFRCGRKHRVNGEFGECKADGGLPCCSKTGWCGKSKDHCTCIYCIDFRSIKPG